jgi:membrane-associated phospholipid phosphatase
LNAVVLQDENEVFVPEPSLHADRQRRQRPIPYYRFVSFISMIFPMGLASFIACSRVVNNMHFPADVVGGASLGLGVAVYVSGMWWPHPNDGLT